jgi:aldehyde dehydrogenase (NAD+)
MPGLAGGAAEMPPRYMTLLDGEWRAGAADRWIEDRNPADTRDLIGLAPALDAREAAEAVGAARAALGGWRATSAVDRGRILLAAAGEIRERAPQIAAEITREMGKTLAEATAETAATADFLEFYGGLGRLPYGDVVPDPRPGVHTRTEREPIGVVLAITPWNDPLLTPARKLGPALIAGNTVVLKTATETPLIALRLAAALQDAGLPRGVLNLVTGRSSEVADALVSDPRVSGITFTGSTPVGMAIRAAVADRNIRVQTEMGGKNAAVVLADADLDLAARTIAAAAFGQAGQRCTATSRLVVDPSVRERLVERVVAHARSLRVGAGADPRTGMGPITSERQMESVLESIAEATRAGARVLCGGHRLTDGAHGCGHFVAPTVLGDVGRGMAIWREEVFGPVLAVVEATGLDAAIEAVNDTSFGLSAAIYTRDLRAAHRFSEGAETGQVAVNLPTSGWAPHLPFGGFGLSGSGFKEQGLVALDFYTRTKTIAVGF